MAALPGHMLEIGIPRPTQPENAASGAVSSACYRVETSETVSFLCGQYRMRLVRREKKRKEDVCMF